MFYAWQANRSVAGNDSMLEGNTFSQLSLVKILTGEGGDICTTHVGAGLLAMESTRFNGWTASFVSRASPLPQVVWRSVQLQDLGQYDFRAFHLFDDDAQAFDFQLFFFCRHPLEGVVDQACDGFSFNVVQVHT